MAETEKLSAAQRSKIRRLSAPRELAPDEEGGELNIVPFLDIIMNVLMFVLATVSVTFTASFDTAPPRRGGASGRPPTAPTLGLTVIVVPDGFSIKARGGNVGPGCSDVGSGLALAKVAAGGKQDYDYAGLGFHSPNMDATHRFQLRRRASVSDQEAIATLILSGCYIGFLPDHYAATFLRDGTMRRVEHPQCMYDVQFVAILRRSPEPSRVAQAFLDALRAAHRKGA